MARWWAEFNTATEQELGYFRAAIQTSGEPVLDLGCGSGRILLPLLAGGIDIDGCDISADMVAEAEAAARRQGLSPTLLVQPMHLLKAPRRYKTIILCGALGIGGNHRHDLEALRRARSHLEAGGTLLITDQELPRDAPRAPETPDDPARKVSVERRRCADGDEIELQFRNLDRDVHGRSRTLEVRAELWRDGQSLCEESHILRENMYRNDEVMDMLLAAGFHDVQIQGGYSGSPPSPDETMLAYVAK